MEIRKSIGSEGGANTERHTNQAGAVVKEECLVELYVQL